MTRSAVLLSLLYVLPIVSPNGEVQSLRAVTAAECVFAIFTEDWGYVSEGKPQLIVGLWHDGHMVWATDQVRGGPPYRAGQVRPAELRKLLTRMSDAGMFNDEQLSVSWVPVDSNFITILARWKGRQLLMRSRDEVEESKHNDAALEDVPERQHFRAAWKRIRRQAALLIPKQSVPVHGELVQVHAALTWRERLD